MRETWVFRITHHSSRITLSNDAKYEEYDDRSPNANRTIGTAPEQTLPSLRGIRRCI